MIILRPLLVTPKGATFRQSLGGMDPTARVHRGDRRRDCVADGGALPQQFGLHLPEDAQHVRCWYLTDMTTVFADVRFRG